MTHEKWDAGEMGCGRLLFELHLRLKSMRPGDRLEVVSLDAGSPVDLPAWCRTTGHTLVSADPPVYVIEKGAA